MRALLLLCMLFALGGCSGNRTIDLDAGVRRTSNGEFNLIVLTEGVVSFQTDAFHKYQYYYTPPLPEKVSSRIRGAAEEARKKNFKVYIKDIRVQTETP